MMVRKILDGIRVQENIMIDMATNQTTNNIVSDLIEAVYYILLK